MKGRPEVLFRHQSGRKKVSVILLDWSVRESFHSLDYLNRQTASRDDYELIWVEFYDRKVPAIEEMVGGPGHPKVDQWMVLGYPADMLYHKHRAYNAGLVAAKGEICVICDSDAMFRPTFIESVINAFEDPSLVAAHLDQVRNFDRKYYPFNFPTFEEVTGPGAVNWLGHVTVGLSTEDDRLHRANYGACMAAKRSDILAVGGSDEHLDYLGYCCGPYDLTFRLLNRGGREKWLTNEFLYHTWHPNQTSINSDYSGPHDGRYMSLMSLHARASGRIRPYLENPCFSIENDEERFNKFIQHVAEHPEPAWMAASPPTLPTDFVYRIENNYRGYDLFVYKNEWFACPTGAEFDVAGAGTLRARNELSIRGLVISERPRKRMRLSSAAEPALNAAQSPPPLVGKPEVLFHHKFRGKKKISVILTDWDACESFHAIEYLNKQTVSRDDYELIWVEFHDRKAAPIERMLGSPGRPMLDQWITLGYPSDMVHHRHRAYNAGLLAASGEICVFCESEAMFRPTFIENILKAFDETAYAAVHIDSIRNLDQRFHPFNYPSFEEMMGPGCVNWVGVTTIGLWSDEDRLHRAGYGACFAARTRDLLAIGGADEHHDYLGASSGPYEMSFRLVNRGRRERWLTNEYLYQTWRPEYSLASEHAGPNDGRDLSLRALHARATGQIRPYLENPCIRKGNSPESFAEFLGYVQDHPEPNWGTGTTETLPGFVYKIESDFRGYDLYVFENDWYACPGGQAFDIMRDDVLFCDDEDDIRLQVRALTPNHPGKKPPGKVQRFVRSLLSEPIHCLPRRALRAAGRVLKKRNKAVA